MSLSLNRARSPLRFRSSSHSLKNEAKSVWWSLASTGAASRNSSSMNSPLRERHLDEHARAAVVEAQPRSSFVDVD
jgi:hypothetical protein